MPQPQPLYGQQPFMQQPQYGQMGQQYMQPQMGQQYLQFQNQQAQHTQQHPQSSQSFGQPLYHQNVNQAPNFNQAPNQPYNNPVINPTNPPQYGGMNQMQGISLSTDKKAETSNLGNEQKQGSNDKVNWLSNNEKGLIDFSDFSS